MAVRKMLHTYTKKTINYLEAFEIRFHRKMLRIPWIKKISNNRLLEIIDTKKACMDISKKQEIG